MKVQSCNYPQYAFTGRCVQVRDAQWVCHTISSTLPHVSTTKIDVMYFDVTKKQLVRPDLVRKLTTWRHYIINKLNDLREEYFQYKLSANSIANGVINQLKEERMGNCHENANVAEVILKMNGIENSGCVTLKTDTNNIDHVVCVFNADNSPISINPGKKTIIIDPWLGEADFASNMFLRYKNLYHQYFKLFGHDKFGFNSLNSFKLKPADIAELREEYPQFVFKSKSRDFMQNKKVPEKPEL